MVNPIQSETILNRDKLDFYRMVMYNSLHLHLNPAAAEAKVNAANQKNMSA